MAHDLMDIGWWLRSVDEDVYGPVSRATLKRFLEQGTVTPNTLARHSTTLDFRPLGDHEALRALVGQTSAQFGARDRLGEVWPKKAKERLALAEGPMRCKKHNRPATQVCNVCEGPYCEKCRVKKSR